VLDTDTSSICENCDAPARRRFCSDRCRQQARKSQTSQNGLRYRTGLERPKTTHFSVDLSSEFQPLQAISKKTPLRCERVNEVTYKITAGEHTNVPACHGFWGGYRTTTAVAWVMGLGNAQWLARCGDQACGPTTFANAKAAAIAMSAGACGDYTVERPIAHLNGLQAKIEDAALTPTRICARQ
jgi:hypothetical protein